MMMRFSLSLGAVQGPPPVSVQAHPSINTQQPEGKQGPGVWQEQGQLWVQGMGQVCPWIPGEQRGLSL